VLTCGEFDCIGGPGFNAAPLHDFGAVNGEMETIPNVVARTFAERHKVELEDVTCCRGNRGGNRGGGVCDVDVGALCSIAVYDPRMVAFRSEGEGSACNVESLIKSHFLTGSGSLGDGSLGSGGIRCGDGSFGLANDNRAVIRNISDGSRGGGACGHVRKSHNIDGESGIAGRIFVDCEIHCEQSAAGGHAVVSIEQTEFNLAEFGFGIQNFHGCAADSVAFGCAVESESFSVILNVHVHSMALKVAAREGYGDRNRVAGLGVDGGNLEHNFALCNCGDGNK